MNNASAKINLALHIIDKRQDGYHQLETIVTFASFGDGLEFKNGEGISLKVKGEYGNRLEDEYNIVRKTAEMINGGNMGAEITLYKNVPVAAGMGGGSSNAAATLKGLSELWGIYIEEEKMMKIAKELGADVPMCLVGKPLVAKGIGEEITRVENMPSFDIVAVNPNVELESKKVFDELEKTDNEALPELPKTEDKNEWVQYLKKCRNDMQRCATNIVPEINECVKILEQTNAEIIRMTGAGATVFALYSSAQEAQNAQTMIQQQKPKYWAKCGKTL